MALGPPGDFVETVKAFGDFVETVKAWAFPLSAIFLLFIYPLLLLVWTIVQGHRAGCVNRDKAPGSTASRSTNRKLAAVPLKKRIHGWQLQDEVADRCANSPQPAFFATAIGGVSLVLAHHTLGFVMAAGNGDNSGNACSSVACNRHAAVLPMPGPHGSVEDPSFTGSTAGGSYLTVAGYTGFCGTAFALVYARWSLPRGGLGRSQRPSSNLRRCSGSSEMLCQRQQLGKAWVAPNIRWYLAPPSEGISLWHSVDLHVKNWLDEDTGLFHYINEIPRGALQKFELQSKLKGNIIEEDARGSKKLQAFGHPVPFNYGCFPQTFRDPNEADSLYNAPGDNDPLDVLDLTAEAAGVGEVVTCRALGAVCLIDEGQADWKIIVVNTKANCKLAAAQSIADVEKLAPGRVDEALRWMDDFKQHSSKGGTMLHFEVHDASRAIGIIEQDHESWKRLVMQTGSDGFARGHWISSPEQERKGKVNVLPMGWTGMVGVGSLQAPPTSFAGLSTTMANQPSYATGRSSPMRRQTSSSSSASGIMSSDTDLGA